MASFAAGHAVLHKRDVRAAIGWSGLILLSPFAGALLYYLFGINRLQRRATRITSTRSGRGLAERDARVPTSEVTERYGEPMGTLSEMVGKVTDGPLVEGNSVELLVDGDTAYPRMLEAIHEAERSVVMETYIFDNDRAGRMFRDALYDAARRGVAVRVLIDGVGARYSRPRMTRVLRRAGIPTAEFLPSNLPWRHPYANLRTHRKILVVDGRTGFVGGMNVREGCLLDPPPRYPVRDLHFRVEGPVVDQLLAELCRDWLFANGEHLDGPPWQSATQRVGPVAARGVPDGPDEDFETIRRTILSALNVARESIRIATPYFLPDGVLISALELAALRGVEVDILLPEVDNLRLVQWAADAQLWQVLKPGCRVWLTPGPFDHSKVMVVDRVWSLIGSSNWDARSLRLNFEYNVECYDRALASQLLQLTEEKMREARRITLEETDRRGLARKLRDGVARLASPYL